LISWKKHPGSETEDLTSTLRMVVETLLHAIEMHSIVADAEEYEAFCAELGKLRESFADPSCTSLLVSAGAAKRVIEEYYQQTSRSLHARTLELHKVLNNFAEGVAAVASGSESTVLHLRDLERQIVRAGTSEQVRSLGTRLTECLETLRIETGRKQERHQQTLAQLQREVERSWHPATNAPGGPAAGDSLSGLPLRAKAESALEAAAQSGEQGFVIAFVVDRVQLINARFGYAVGDQILVLFREHLAKHFHAGDKLFRWTGPVFVALLNRPNLPDGMRTEVKHLTSAKLETTVQIGTRSVMLPVSSTAAIFSLFEINSAPLLIEQIDAFVAGHLRR
jgi:GGDEF domain-containing protein